MIDGPLIGIRVWNVNLTTTQTTLHSSGPAPGLQATNACYVWLPGVNEAKCNTYSPLWFRAFMGSPYSPYGIRRDHMKQHSPPVPGPGCVCGFHAFYDLDGLQKFFADTLMRSLLASGIVGLVRGWGDVRLHPNGWRSHFAEPMALFQGLNDSKLPKMRNAHLVPEIARTYNVPVLPSSSYPYILEEFGTIVPPTMRPTHEKPGTNPTTT